MIESSFDIHRRIVERIIIKGELILETPAHLGGTKAFSLTDMPVLTDALEGKVLLPGASLAGALRSYLREIESGYNVKEKKDGLVPSLFGQLAWSEKQGDESQGDQSYCIVSDAIGELPAIEIRDSVMINPETRTAEDKKKYDLELLEAGTKFPIRIELMIPEDKPDLAGLLAVALQGLETGKIHLGARKRRGYGKCKVTSWKVYRYNLRTAEGLLGYLKREEGKFLSSGLQSLTSQQPEMSDQREWFQMDVKLSLPGSLLIRSETGNQNSADVVHLRSKRNGTDPIKPIISGTSFGGLIRHRALRIARTLSNNPAAADFVDNMFGPQIEGTGRKPQASRVWIEETIIEKPTDMVQHRLKLDRFTGGAYTSALFNEQAVYGKTDTVIALSLLLRNPKSEEIGLLLLVLKDLWSGDLPVGGESSIGRGRLKGITSVLIHKRKCLPENTWKIEATSPVNGLSIQGVQKDLGDFVVEFSNRMGGAK